MRPWTHGPRRLERGAGFEYRLVVILPWEAVVILHLRDLPVPDHRALALDLPVGCPRLQRNVLEASAQNLPRPRLRLIRAVSPTLGITEPRHGLHVVPVHVFAAAPVRPHELAGQGASVAFEAFVEIEDRGELPSRELGHFSALHLLDVHARLVVDAVAGVVPGVDDVSPGAAGHLQRVQELAIQVIVVRPVLGVLVVPAMLGEDDVGRKARPLLGPGKPLAHVVVHAHHVHVFDPPLPHDLGTQVEVDLPPLEPHQPLVLPERRMDPPLRVRVVHDKGVWGSVGPPGHDGAAPPLVRILGLGRHLVELDVVLVIHVELEPPGVGLARLLVDDLPPHGPGRRVVLVVAVLCRPPELDVPFLQKTSRALPCRQAPWT